MQTLSDMRAKIYMHFDSWKVVWIASPLVWMENNITLGLHYHYIDKFQTVNKPTSTNPNGSFIYGDLYINLILDEIISSKCYWIKGRWKIDTPPSPSKLNPKKVQSFIYISVSYISFSLHLLLIIYCSFFHLPWIPMCLMHAKTMCM